MPEVVAAATPRVAVLPRPAGRAVAVLVAAFAACLTFTAMFLATAPPAAAHDQFLSSDPVDGDVLDAPPEAITLTFSGEPLETGAEIVLTGDDGADLALQDLAADGAVLTGSVPATLPAGDYDVAWHIVSGDGHPLEGAFTFSVDGPEEADGEAVEPPEPIEEELAEPEVEESADAPPADADAVAGGDDAASDTPGEFPAVPTGLAVVGAIAVVIMMLVVMRRKMKDDERLRGRGHGDDGGASAVSGAADGDRDNGSKWGPFGGDGGSDGGSGGGDSGSSSGGGGD
ncbi:hypothetical protein GCM10028784_35450 [Myceligenerans cantabricum]